MILRLPDSGKRLSYELERKAVGNINLRVRPDGMFLSFYFGNY